MSNRLGDGAPFTQVEQGINESTLTYQLPPTGRFDIDSVVATIDNSGGSAVRPMLYLTNASGEVIAKKRQSDPIPAGGAGTATWALRLADEAAGGVTAERNGVVVGTEPAIDFRDTATVTWALTDDPGSSRVQVRATAAAGASAADARHYGYLLFSVFTPGPPIGVVLDDDQTIVGTKANGATIGNIYDLRAVAAVQANDYLSMFFQNQSGAVRQAQLNRARIQNLGTGAIEDAGDNAAPRNVANGGADLAGWQHLGGAALLNYAAPTNPKFVAAGTYSVVVRYFLSFWV